MSGNWQSQLFWKLKLVLFKFLDFSMSLYTSLYPAVCALNFSLLFWGGYSTPRIWSRLNSKSFPLLCFRVMWNPGEGKWCCCQWKELPPLDLVWIPLGRWPLIRGKWENSWQVGTHSYKIWSVGGGKYRRASLPMICREICDFTLKVVCKNVHFGKGIHSPNTWTLTRYQMLF